MAGLAKIFTGVFLGSQNAHSFALPDCKKKANFGFNADQLSIFQIG
jgi:hypothetical protein